MQSGQSHPIRTILIIWFCWAVLVLGFQTLAAARVELKAPDDVLMWTGAETMPGAHNSQPYLLEPFLNRQVAYDSEFYLSIAVAGYDDPSLRAVWTNPENPAPIWDTYPQAFAIPDELPAGRPYGLPENFEPFSLNYAFFPFYPFMIRLVGAPLGVLGLNPIATVTLAGVIVSLLGALGAMLALYDLTRETLEKSGAIRAAFYRIAFPTGFFLAMVHTEGLFVGLAFGSLALLRRKQWLGASLLAAGATLTRAVGGGALIVPFAIAWLAEALPWIWSVFSREKNAGAGGSRPRWDQPGLALFSLMVVVISFFSGCAQGMHRYILTAPATFVMLGELGSRDEAFDRSWTIGSLLKWA